MAAARDTAEGAAAQRIHGPRLTLRRVEERDLPDILRWLADPEVRAFYGDPPAGLAEARRDYIEPDVNPVYRYVIEEEGRGVGEIQYDHPYEGAEYAWTAGIDIFVGEPDARGRGLGTEAVRTMLSYLFEGKRVHRATIDPEVGNERARRAYEKAGFRLDGVLRHHAFEHGEYVDTAFMTMLEDEWPAARARWEAEAGAPVHVAWEPA